jgi:hypothetical protein
MWVLLLVVLQEVLSDYCCFSLVWESFLRNYEREVKVLLGWRVWKSTEEDNTRNRAVSRLCPTSVRLMAIMPGALVSGQLVLVLWEREREREWARISSRLRCKCMPRRGPGLCLEGCTTEARTQVPQAMVLQLELVLQGTTKGKGRIKMLVAITPEDKKAPKPYNHSRTISHMRLKRPLLMEAVPLNLCVNSIPLCPTPGPDLAPVPAQDKIKVLVAATPNKEAPKPCNRSCNTPWMDLKLPLLVGVVPFIRRVNSIPAPNPDLAQKQMHFPAILARRLSFTGRALAGGQVYRTPRKIFRQA